MKLKILILLILILSPAFAEDDVKRPEPQLKDLPTHPFKPTVRVIDEEGNPIVGARVKMGIFNLREKGEYKNIVGDTNVNGEFTVEHQAHLPIVPIEVTKEHYYLSRSEYEDRRFSLRDIMNQGGFQPWDPKVDVILKKVGRPIPMYVRNSALKNSRIDIPGYDVQYKFDLLEWDWLHPNGKGKVADWGIILETGKGNDGSENPVLKLSLMNVHDGMSRIERFNGTESLLRMPRLAPDSSYNIRHLEFSAISDNKRLLENGKPTPMPMGYFLRIRTVLDEEKNVKSCQHGMIVVRDPRLTDPLIEVYKRAGSGAESIPLLEINGIFINPSTMDRNLEWDNQKNLYEGL